MIRDIEGMTEKITKGSRLDTIIPIEPRDFLISETDHEKMTSPQLQEYIARQKLRGVANIKSFEIENERRYAICAAAFILTLIGMSLSSKKVKGGMGINIGIGLVLSFSYILFTTVTSSFCNIGLHIAICSDVDSQCNLHNNRYCTLSPRIGRIEPEKECNHSFSRQASSADAIASRSRC